MLLAKFVRSAFLSTTVIERTNVRLIAARAIAFNTLVFVWMIQPLNRSVALAAFETTLAVVPADTTLQGLTILGGVLEQVGRASEVTRVMRENTRL